MPHATLWGGTVSHKFSGTAIITGTSGDLGHMLTSKSHLLAVAGEPPCSPLGAHAALQSGGAATAAGEFEASSLEVLSGLTNRRSQCASAYAAHCHCYLLTRCSQVNATSHPGSHQAESSMRRLLGARPSLLNAEFRSHR